jgi:hypothetical protein
MKEYNKLLLSYTSELLRWIKEGKFHIFSIIIIVATVLYFLKIITYEPKYISAAFLIFGLSIIIMQMIGDAKRFSEHQPNTPKNWLKKRPPLKQKPRPIQINSVFENEMSSKISYSLSISENASLEKKVEFLLDRYQDMEKEIKNLGEKLDNNRAEVKNEIKDIFSKIKQIQKELDLKISHVTVSDYDLRLFSVILMICGTFLQILI